MKNTVSEVLELVKENNVKFIRLGFCDLFGNQKNISIMPEELPEAFKNGVSFDAHAIKGFKDVTASDLFLFPEAETLTVLPWRPGPGSVVRFYCEIRNPDGSPFSQDGRFLLKQVSERCHDMGYQCKIGAECEFYLFKTGENGQPTETTLDIGGYLDIYPLDRGEDIRREICLTLEEMGIQPESSHHEQGPGQNEVDFKFSDALLAADNLLTFKSVVKAIATRNGLHASFMPKPIENSPGSGLHVNLSLAKGNGNIFKQNPQGEHSATAESFMAGIMEKAPEITLFLNPTANSYERLGQYEAPRFVSWAHQNRSQLIRIPAAVGERARMELRSPDPAINPHLAFSLIMAAGLYGIRSAKKLPTPMEVDLYTAERSLTEGLTLLPDSLDKAIRLARESDFVREVIGEELLYKYIGFKEEEAAAFNQAKDKAAFRRSRYFNYI